jgi:hypothetical protein
MTARLLALLVFACAVPAAAQDRPDKREIGPEEIQALQQQLAAIAALQGKTPEELEKFLKMFGDGKFADFPKQFPNGIPKLPELPKIGPNLRPPAPPPPPPMFDPNGNPVPPQNVAPPGPPNNPFGPNGMNPNIFNPQIDPKLNEHPGIAEMAKFWEQNFGPLEKTPAVRDALLELFEMSRDGKLMDGEWKGLWDELQMDGKGNDGLADWFKDMNLNGGKWDMADWGKGWNVNWKGGNWGGGNWGGGNWGGGGWGGGNWGGGGWGGGGFSAGGGGSWLPVILLVVFAAVGLILWKFWPMIKNRETPAARAVRTLGNWPIDPRTINSREELVRAFEYLSILLCGDAARVWNHLTIARALRSQIPESDLVADELAKLYELARYTPAHETMSPVSLADARRCLCHLAGVNA